MTKKQTKSAKQAKAAKQAKQVETTPYAIKIRKRLFYTVQIVARGNGEVVLTSETYYSKGNAQRAALSLSRHLELDIK